MTHEELLKLADVWKVFDCARPWLESQTTASELAQGYLALSAKLEAQEVELTVANTAAAEWRTKLAEKMVQLEVLQAEKAGLRDALQRVVDGETECGCEHDDENCCALKADFHCPFCIAAQALVGEASRGEVVTACPECLKFHIPASALARSEAWMCEQNRRLREQNQRPKEA